VDYKGGELSNVYTFGVSSHHRAALSFTRGGFLRKKSASICFYKQKTTKKLKKTTPDNVAVMKKMHFYRKKVAKRFGRIRKM